MTVLATASLHAQLEPFGDPARTFGGLARAAALMKKARAETGAALWVDVGDALFGRSDVAAELLPQAERKAKAMAEAFTRMGNDAFVPGEHDFLHGPDFVRALGLRSLLDGGLGLEGAPSATLKDAGGVKVAFVAASGPDATRVLREQSAQMRRAGADLVIALVHATGQETFAIVDRLPPGTVDVAIAGHTQSEIGAEAGVLAGRAPVFQIPWRGRALLRLDFTLRAGSSVLFVAPGEAERRQTAAHISEQLREAEALVEDSMQDVKVRALTRRLEAARQAPDLPADRSLVAWHFARLAPGMAEDAEIARIAQRYAEDVETLNLSVPEGSGKGCSPARVGQPVYTGADEKCRGCHAGAFADWDPTGHARALSALTKLNRAHDLECVRCHVTGLFAPGGLCRIRSPQGREGVQCEACHGPASAHAETPARELAAVTEQICKSCHTPDHDPTFRYERDLTRVFGPGHHRAERPR